LKCIEYNPKYHGAYYNLANLYENIKETDSAVVWYKKTVEVNPRFSDAFYNLGLIYINRQEYKYAIDCYKKAVGNLSTFTLAYVNMAICHIQLSKYEDAFNTLAIAKKVLPTDNTNLSDEKRTSLTIILRDF
jgi:superkiller protein 3